MPALHSIIQSISHIGSGRQSVKYTMSKKDGANLAAEVVTLVSDAAATPASTQSVADGRTVGDDESAAIAMQ